MAQLINENQRLKASNVAITQQNVVLDTKLKVIEKKNTELNEKYDNLLEQLKLANQRRFSPSSEANILQKNLFDEIGIASSEEDSANDKNNATTTYTVTRKAKNHPKRLPLPEHLPRIQTFIDVDDADKVCDCGCTRVQMGKTVSEELIVEPAKLIVKQTIRPKYICKNKVCENEKIYLSVLPLKLLPKTNASPSIIADIVTKKYVDHLPLCRQEKIGERLNILFKRNTMCGWLMIVADKCEPLYKLLNQIILSYDIIHADETTVQVLKEVGRANQQKSYIWTYKGGPPDKPAVFFEYQETRQNKHPIKFLKEAEGYIMADGYNGYDWLATCDKLIRIYCMAHARCPFAELVKLADTRGASHEILEYFTRLYAIEKQAKEEKLSYGERFFLRLTESKPILDDLFAYLKTIKTPPKGKLDKAIHYMLSRGDAFYRYLYDGRLPIDNNELENQIRPFALGRKNWLFLGSPKGAKAACIFYTLIQTARLNNIEPQKYLAAVFEKLPYCKTQADYEQLLPWNITL